MVLLGVEASFEVNRAVSLLENNVGANKLRNFLNIK
jgi:hypothetical protein